MILRRTLRAALAVLLPAALLTASGATAQAAPGDRGPIVHLFQWRWDSVAQECEDVLGPNGYSAVQVSPPQEHVVLPGEGHPWWQDYQPVGYRLDETRRGTAADFSDMVDRCRGAGVKIYVDAVLNHMTGSGSVGSGQGSAGSDYGKYTYPDLHGDGRYGYSEQDFHNAECGRDIQDWSDPWEVRTCELLGLSDLATGDDYVRDRLAGYLNGLIDLGVAGFRYDAAKHMAADDVAAVTGRLRATVPGWNEPPYVFQEVIADSAVGGGEYTGIGDVTEFGYQGAIGEHIAAGDLQSAKGTGAGLLPSDDAVVFVANHDTQRSDPVLTHRTDRARYDLAQAFMLAQGYGTPKVMSSYDWSSSTDEGPPASADGTTAATECGAGWVCEHRALNAMPTFTAATEGAPVTWLDDASAADRAALERDGVGAAAFNASAEAWTTTLSTSLPDGTYCDVATGAAAGGGCTGASVEVSGGQATATVPANGFFAVHTGATA